MTAAEIQTLITGSACYLCKVPPGLVGYVILVELDMLAKGETIPDDPQALIDQAACLVCLVPLGLVPYLILKKLQDLS